MFINCSNYSTLQLFLLYFGIGALALGFLGALWNGITGAVKGVVGGITGASAGVTYGQAPPRVSPPEPEKKTNWLLIAGLGMGGMVFMVLIISLLRPK